MNKLSLSFLSAAYVIANAKPGLGPSKLQQNVPNLSRKSGEQAPSYEEYCFPSLPQSFFCVFLLTSGKNPLLEHSGLPVIATFGEDTILPCQLGNGRIPESTNFKIQWTFSTPSKKIELISYDGKIKKETENESYKGRIQLFNHEHKRGNMSLKLKHIVLPDQGKYICTVSTEKWLDEVVIERFIYKRACSVLMDSCVVFFLFFPLAAVTLDSEYKHPEIIISEDKRKASLKAPTPGQPGAAVETLIVVGKEGYAAGKHYWEVRVGEGLDWELGVLTQAERDKAKKASLVGPLGEGCWALRSVQGDLFSSQSENKLEKKDVPYQVIGLFLDREAGDISFHNAAIIFPINSIPIQSTEKLYPFLSLGKAAEDSHGHSLEIIPIGIPMRAFSAVMP
uniref:Uncharacterized protein n=1 Tax=Varanus komodoensis TaxID=61221 RepID=A0A8D2IP48_VARKO